MASAVHADILGMDELAADPERNNCFTRKRTQSRSIWVAHCGANAAVKSLVASRVIIDPADRALPPAALVGLRSDGTPDVGAVFRSVLQQPSQLPALLRIALDAKIAGAALRCGRRMLGAGLGFPDFGEGPRAAAIKERNSPFPELGSGFAAEGRR